MVGRKAYWFLLAILMAALAALAGEPPAKEPLKFDLEPGTPQARVLSPGQPHEYSISLQRGQYVKVVAMQEGVDLVLTVYGPDGKKLAEVDSPNGANGPEPFAAEVPATGVYRFEVKDLDGTSPPGSYEMRVAALLSPEDYARHKIVDVPRAVLEACWGNYEISPGRLWLVGIMAAIFSPDQKDGLLAMDTGSLRIGPLKASSPTDFFMGPDTEPYPAEEEFHFTMGPDGKAASLTWTSKGGKPVTCKRVDPFRMERVTFQNGAVTLKGWLILPGGKGPFPAVVHAHGSQASPADIGQVGNFFLHQGAAFLSFDKRGAGESTGDWKASSMEDLAGDVLAGVAFLKARSDIDASRIGIWGISQGGWVGSIAAAKSPDVKFLIIHSGSGVSVVDNMVYETSSQMRDAGLSEKDVLEGAAFQKKILQMMTDGAPYEAVVKAGEEAKGKPWEPHCSTQKLPRDFYIWTWMKLNGNYDSTAYLKKVTCPVIWFLAKNDTQVSVAQGAPRLQAAFDASGNKDCTLVIVPNANHGMLYCNTSLLSEIYRSKRYAEGYWDRMAAWFAAHEGPAEKQARTLATGP